MPIMAELEPNNWQQHLLRHIHVIDKPGQWGTCVHVDNSGRAYPHPTKEIYYVPHFPITDFDKKNIKPPENLTQDAVDSIRQQLIDNRGEEFAFKPTLNEQLKIDRIFVELAKHPEISYFSFFDPAFHLIAGKDNFMPFDYDPKSLPLGMHQEGRVILNDICFEHSQVLGPTIREEMLHRLISQPFNTRLNLRGPNLTSVKKMQTIIEQSNALNLLDIKNACHTLPLEIQGRYDFTLTAQEMTTLAEIRKVHTTYIEENPDSLLNPDPGLLLLFLNMSLKEIQSVYTDPTYTGQSDYARSGELYAKCMHHYMGYRYRSEAYAELFLKSLNMPEVAAGLKRDHDILLTNYRTHIPESERLKGALYAESVAKRLEVVLPGSTLYKFGRSRD
jgi:hypothetical protein